MLISNKGFDREVECNKTHTVEAVMCFRMEFHAWPHVLACPRVLIDTHGQNPQGVGKQATATSIEIK
jgi:hypothetical protein